MIERNRILILFSFFISPFFCNAQEDIKYEKEIPIDSHLVPLKARTFIQSLNVEILYWVKEINFNRRSYEVKALWNKLPASIEFDSTGVFEDAEITIAQNKVPAATRKNIKQVLKQHFVKFKYAKIQLQFSGSHDALIKRMAQNDEQAAVTIKYEIELYGKIKTAWRMYEYLFDRNGLFEQKREISGVIYQYDNF
jgi:hypothetical protein